MHNILITQKILIDKYNEINWCLDDNWFQFFKSKKINLVPVGSDFFAKKILLIKPRGIIISGGNDLYDKVKLKENLIREQLEIKILKFAIKNKIPVLAICRGFQLVGKYFRSKIYKIRKHVKTSHNLLINNNNLAAKISALKVNSYHNYAIKNLPRHFNVIVKYKDKSIEIAKTSKYNILCLMFHPERKNITQKEINKIVYSHFKI